MHAYVINLARSPGRRAHMLGQLADVGLPYTFVEAVDGRLLDVTDPSVLDPCFREDRGFRPGALGCAFSHLRAIRMGLEAGFDRVVVLEDDVVLPPDVVPLLESVGAAMGGAEIALLNFHAPAPCRVTAEGSVALPGSRSLVEPLALRGLTSGGAYVMTAEACRRVERQALPLKVHFDNWEYLAEQGVLERVRCVVPMPITNSLRFRSTIDYYPPGSLQGRLREAIARANPPVVAQMLVMRRKRMFRRLGWTGRTEFVEPT